jgi:hypothetical protein
MATGPGETAPVKGLRDSRPAVGGRHLRGDPIAFSYPETEAVDLSVVIGLRSYVATIARFPKSVAVIGGSAIP